MIFIWLLIAVFCFAFGIYQIFTGLHYLFYVFKLLRHGLRTQGRVVNYTAKIPDKTTNNEYFWVMHFTDSQGQSVYFVDWQAEYHPPILDLNKEVNIIYHPNRPEYAAIYDFWHLWIIPGHAILLGTAAIYIGRWAMEKWIYLNQLL